MNAPVRDDRPTIAAFLRARFREREEAAEILRGDYWIESMDEGVGDALRVVADPDDVLADITAKRRIVDDYETTTRIRDELAAKLQAAPSAERGGRDLARWERSAYEATILSGPVRLLALPFAGHPDYEEGWRP